MIIATDELLTLERERLHYEEKPISQISSILANTNRDSKRRQKPYEPKDFAFYHLDINGHLPHGRFGAAALHLQGKGLFPSWALFCFPELVRNASSSYLPEVCAFMSENAILLAPLNHKDYFSGFLIAREKVSNSFVAFKDENGRTYDLKVPLIDTKIVAIEDAILYL